MYLLEDKATQKCAVVDPAWDIEEIVQEIEKRGLTPSACLLTHSHYDHVNMVGPLLVKYPSLPVYMLDIEIDWSNFRACDQLAFRDTQSIFLGSGSEIFRLIPSAFKKNISFRARK